MEEIKDMLPEEEESSIVTFTDENGNQLKVNAGNSWVCIANKNYVPSIK